MLWIVWIRIVISSLGYIGYPPVTALPVIGEFRARPPPVSSPSRTTCLSHPHWGRHVASKNNSTFFPPALRISRNGLCQRWAFPSICSWLVRFSRLLFCMFLKEDWVFLLRNSVEFSARSTLVCMLFCLVPHFLESNVVSQRLTV